MKAKISALMDGELEGSELSASLAPLLERDAAARDTWCMYHLIGDALKGAQPLAAGFCARLGERLAAEPTVLAPRAVSASGERRRRWALSIAASVAAAALVGWLAFVPRHAAVPVPHPVAQLTPPPVARVAVRPAPSPAVPARVPLPREADDYLLAHQSYSLRGSLQGMMPYVRTVAIEKMTGKP